MKIEKKIYLQQLFDLYSSLLTEYQRDVFSLYYEEDLSLYEIAENKQISRNAVFSLLHRVEKILEDYEDKLNLLKKKEKIIKLLKDKVDEKTISKVEEFIEG